MMLTATMNNSATHSTTENSPANSPVLHRHSIQRSRSLQLPPLSDLLNEKPLQQHSPPPSRIPSITEHTPVKLASTTSIPMSERKSYAFISHSPATFPTHEPSIDNAQLARRKRRRTSPNELTILQKEFEVGHTPNKARRQEIASKVNMTEKAVQIWFQNRRQALRKLQMNDHSIHQTTTITLPEVIHDVATSPTVSATTPTKFAPLATNGNSDSFATSPLSSSVAQKVDLQSSPPATHINNAHQLLLVTVLEPLRHLLPTPSSSLHPRPATWTLNSSTTSTIPTNTATSAPAFAPVTPVRQQLLQQNQPLHQLHSGRHQLPTPGLNSIRFNKTEGANNLPFINVLPTPSSTSKFSFQKSVKTTVPSTPADFKVKSIMSLSNLNSPAPGGEAVKPLSRKRNALGDITNTQNTSTSDAGPKKKKEGEFECVENLLSLRTANWK